MNGIYFGSTTTFERTLFLPLILEYWLKKILNSLLPKCSRIRSFEDYTDYNMCYNNFLTIQRAELQLNNPVNYIVVVN